MNIFFLHWIPRIAAISAIDKHVVKMVLESTQLLYTVYHMVEPELLSNCPYSPYKITHKNHPCAKWCRENYSNFYWLLCLAWEYCKEYTHRYNKIHSCQKHIIWMIHNVPSEKTLPRGDITMPPQAMPDKYKCESTIQAYRNYYIGEKIHFSRYTKREPPDWFKEHLQRNSK